MTIRGNCGPGVKQWQPTTGFMITISCGLRDWDQLRALRSTYDYGTNFSFTF